MRATSHDLLPFSLNRRYSRRAALRAGAGLAALAAVELPRRALGQAAPPATTPAATQLPYPTLTIKATSQGFSLQASVAEGRYAVVLDNASKQPVGTSILQLPNGVSEADVAAAFGKLPAVPPRWYYDTLMPGAPDVALPGKQTEVILDLVPGRYVVVSSDPPAPPTATFDVTSGTPPASAPAPHADARIVETDFAFPGLPSRVAPGRHIWQVVNASSQPHMLDLSRIPAGMTLPQVITALQQPSGSSGGMGMSMANFVPAGGLMLLSPGRTGWAVLDLAPGHYTAVCSVPDPLSGKPHYMLGMIGLFDVGAGGTPSATPAM